MSQPLLSILVTTYNRSSFLSKCLSSIKETCDVLPEPLYPEVIVLDNGCTDDTQEVLKYFERIMPLRILYEAENISFVPGIIKCISHASGEYCWFLGDDDYLTEQAGKVCDFVMTRKPEILLLNHCFYSGEAGDMKFLMKGKKDFLLRKPESSYSTYRDYLLNVRHNNAFFTHIAAVIFRRDLWKENFSQEALERHAPSYSFHVYMFLSILKKAKVISYFRGQAVALRVGAPLPPLLTEDGRYYRFLMDVEYFTNMFRDVFQEKELVRHFRDVMLKKSVAVLLMGSKIRSRFSLGFYRRLFKLLYTNYRGYPFFWYGIIPMLVTPRMFFVLAYRWFLEKR